MIGLSRKLSNLLPRQVLITIHKPFVRSDLDNGGVLYNQFFPRENGKLCLFSNNRSHSMYVKRKNLLRIRPKFPSTSPLVQKGLSLS